MTRTSTVRPARLLVLSIAAVMAVSACSPAASTAPSTAPASSAATTSTPATSDAPSEAPSESTAASAEPSPDAEAAIADLRSRLEGQPLKVGSSASPNASVVGYFKTLEYLAEDFGVEVEQQSLDGDPLVAALVSGQVQVAQLSLAGTANAFSNGANFVAVGVNDQKNLFVVAAKAPTASLEELRGKSFGATSNLNQITGQTARKCLQSGGLDIEKDVQLVRFNNTGEVTAAIRSGQVVGGVSATFRLTRIFLEDGPDSVNILCYGLDENPSISSLWTVDRTWLESNGDMALALILSELKAARWSKEDKAGWIALAKEHIEGYTDEAGELDYQAIVVEADNWPVNGGLDQELCDTTLQTSFELGAITEEIACDELVDYSYQERALEILGTQ